MYNNAFYNPQVSLDRINAQIGELEKMRNQVQQMPNQMQQPSINQTFQLTPNNQNSIKYVNSVEEVKKSIEEILEQGLNTNNLEHLYKLVKINKMTKESDSMRYRPYGNYGHYEEYNDYGRYDNEYGRRGVDTKYRGHQYMDRMYNDYGRYEEGRREYNRGDYNAKEDTLKSLEYMLESMVDFVKMLKSEANSQEEMELIREYTKKISEM